MTAVDRHRSCGLRMAEAVDDDDYDDECNEAACCVHHSMTVMPFLHINHIHACLRILLLVLPTSASTRRSAITDCTACHV